MTGVINHRINRFPSASSLLLLIPPAFISDLSACQMGSHAASRLAAVARGRGLATGPWLCSALVFLGVVLVQGLSVTRVPFQLGFRSAIMRLLYGWRRDQLYCDPVGLHSRSGNVWAWGFALWEQEEAQAWAGRSGGTVSFTHQQCRGSGAAGSTAGSSSIQAVSHSQRCSWADVQVEVRRLGGVCCLGRRRALALTISCKPSLWPLACVPGWECGTAGGRAGSCGAMPRPFSKSCSLFPVLLAHPLQQLPTRTEENTSIMQQFLPPSVFGIFSTFLYLE